jgi:hypothetical protein
LLAQDNKNFINFKNMNKSISIIVLIVIGLIIFVTGGALGIMYQSSKPQAQINNQVKVDENDLAKRLSSKVIAPIIANGTITKIDGKNITIISDKDSFDVAMTNNAKVYSFAIPANNPKGSQSPSSQQEVAFSSLKVGQTVNVTLIIIPGGSIQGESIFILPIPGVSSPAQ